jgi:hypothetical protein
MFENRVLRRIFGPKGEEVTGGWRVIALMMKAASTSETSVNFYQTTRRNIPEDSHLKGVMFSCNTCTMYTDGG